MNKKIDKIKDIIQDIYELDDRIEELNISKISDSNEFYDFKWVAVMLKDEEERLEKIEEEKNASRLMNLEREEGYFLNDGKFKPLKWYHAKKKNK